MQLRDLENSLELMHTMNPKKTDGEWLEEQTEEIGAQIRDWDLLKCESWKNWSMREELSPGLTKKDIGVDAVGTRANGKYVAIQCKSRQLDEYGTGSPITKKELNKFLSMTQNRKWEERWIVTNGDNPLAQDAKQTQGIIENPPKLVNIVRDLTHEIQARKLAQTLNHQVNKKTEMQNEAVNKCVSILQQLVESDSGGSPIGEARGRLILPCGTGKTRVSLRIVEELTEFGQLSVVLCPSIALVAQIRREYLQFCNKKIDALAVCSDKTVGVTKKDEGILPENDPTRDTSFVSANEVKGRVTTNASEIAEWIEKTTNSENRIKVIFGTYQSASRIAEALEISRRTIQVLIADDAHRTAGIRKSKSKNANKRIRDFTLCHEQAAFPTKYRVYQTATPRVYTIQKIRRVRNDWLVRTMDDESIFGVELYRRSYRDAVKNEWLCDYRIIAIGVNDAAAFEKANRLASVARADSIKSLKNSSLFTWIIVCISNVWSNAWRRGGICSNCFMHRLHEHYRKIKRDGTKSMRKGSQRIHRRLV